MMKNNVPINYRDYCAHLLIPLNRCREENLYMPWTCGTQKHGYEKCQYEESDHTRRNSSTTTMSAARHDHTARIQCAEDSSTN